MPARVKLGLNELTDAELPAKALTIASQMGDNAATFPTPNPALAAITATANQMNASVLDRDALLAQAQNLTVQIRNQRTILESLLETEGNYVQGISDTLPESEGAELITLAGMDVAASTHTPVGEMPKVEGLTATQGDGAGEIDLHWNPIKRGLQTYIVEYCIGEAPTGPWINAGGSRKSSQTVPGLTTGQRYWFRVSAQGAAGRGTPSEVATKVAP